MAEGVFFIDIGPDGAVAVHPQRLKLPVLVAPIPDEDKATKFNAIREELLTIGCMRLPHHAFGFDSSFIGPDSANRFTQFAKLMRKLRDQDDADPKRLPPISIFGHADPTGGEEYNKHLSGRRALAVYGLLIRNAKIWVDLSAGFKGDQWGDEVHRSMLSISLQKLGDGSDEPPFFDGPVVSDDPEEKKEIKQKTDAAVKAYKEARGAPAPASSTFDPATRDKLIPEYMNAICKDETGENFVLKADVDFLARGKGTKQKGDVQGCGEFNPIFLLTKEEDALFNSSEALHATRDALYAKDRRVVAYIFKHGTEVDPKKWPCPIATDEDTKPCRLRFWAKPDRRGLGEERRIFGKKMELAQVDDDGNPVTDDRGLVIFNPIEETGNTMECRFYHGFAVHSPCEAGLKEWVVRFRVDGLASFGQTSKPIPLANCRYVLKMGSVDDAAEVRDVLDGDGTIRIPVVDEHVQMTISLDAAALLTNPDADKPSDDKNKLVDGKFPDEDSFLPIVLDAGELRKTGSDADVDDLASKQRLYNLGFGPSNPEKWDRQKDLVPAAAAYRKSRKLPKQANLRQELVKEHDLEGAPPPLDPDDDPTGDPSTADPSTAGPGGTQSDL